MTKNFSFQEYRLFIEKIKTRIRSAQIKASFSVNTELIHLYWDIGRDVVEGQNKDGWGASVIDKMSTDIQKEFPGIEGFSPSNISRMRTFYLTWKDVQKVSAQVVPKLPEELIRLPWGQHIVLLFKVKIAEQRLWYAQKSLEYGWSRTVLVHQIEANAYSRQSKAITNFKVSLPPLQSDLAKQIIKDPYNFDFLMLKNEYNERVLESALIDEIQKFLLELGKGFSFVGRQVHLEIGNKDYYIDLLFYHLKLRCFIVIELKTEEFKPEFAGKMNFYLSAVDDLLRYIDDKPSIGIILCKTRNKLIAEYALRDIKKPVGISRYFTRIVEKLPDKLEGMLPTIEDLEKSFEKNM
jgi:predicted nuclease of restriction endonuclease-like (RecB) superfamily